MLIAKIVFLVHGKKPHYVVRGNRNVARLFHLWDVSAGISNMYV